MAPPFCRLSPPVHRSDASCCRGTGFIGRADHHFNAEDCRSFWRNSAHATEDPRPKEPMYPVLFRLGDFEITSFGVLVAIAALVGIRLFSRELARSRLPQDAVDAAIAGVIGGLIGAKL